MGWVGIGVGMEQGWRWGGDKGGMRMGWDENEDGDGVGKEVGWG